MPTDRGRSDLPREYSWYREQQQGLARLQDRIAATRDDEGIYRLNEDHREQSALLSEVSKFALMSSLAVLGARKAGGTDWARRAMGNLGSTADKVRQQYIQVTSMGAAEFLRLTQYGKNDIGSILKAGAGDASQYRHLEIVKAVEDVSRVAQITGGAAGSSSSFYQDLVAANKKRITERFAAGSKSIGEVQELTVGKIMDMSEGLRKELFGSTTIEGLNHGLQKGYIGRDLGVGGGMYWDSVKNKVLHAPTLGQFASGAKNLANQVNIPFTGIRFGDILAPPIEHMFSKGRYGAVVRDPVNGVNRGIVLGGNLYREVNRGGKQRLQHVSDGYRVGETGIMAESHMARKGMLGIQKGSIYTNNLDNKQYSKQHPYKAFAQAASELVGVGPQYRSADQVGVQVFNAAKRHMSGVPTMKETYAANSAGFRERLARQVSENLGVDPATGLRKSFLNTLAQQADQIPTSETWNTLSGWQKLKAIAGDESKVIFTNPKAKDVLGKPMVARAVKKPPGSGTANYGTRDLMPGESYAASLSGKSSNQVPLQQYAYESSAINRMSDISHYMTNRLNTLIGATTGIGFRPTAGPLGAVGNLAKIYGAYTGMKVGVEALRYTDYMMSINGYSPSDVALDTYATGRNFLQQMREATGVSPAARYIEDLMPGSVDSSLFSTLRTVGPAAYGVYRKSPLAIAAGIAMGAVMGPGVTETPEETRNILSGEQLVPINAGRYWMMGKQPFEGGKTQYFAPGFFARMRSGYKYTDTLYGSEEEYFQRHSSLPTPSNLFGLMHEQEALYEKHKYDRPYASHQGTNGQQFRDSSRTNTQLQHGANGPPASAASNLGFASLQNRPPDVASASGSALASRLGQLSELSGIYKFALWNATGLSDLNARGSQVLADPSFMRSDTRSFFDEGLGGMGGMSELYRRFVTSDEYRTQRNAQNPIRNTMPNWLPGTNSAYQGGNKYSPGTGDMGFHIDFTMGDPYSKIKHGEFRLPGAAHERMYRLHSGSPGVYDAVDRLLILSDIAPHSDAYKHYRAIVGMWEKSGVLDDYWTGKVQTSREHVTQKMERYKITHRRFYGTSLPRDKREEVLSNYNLFEQAAGGAWENLTHNVIPKIGITVPLLGPMLANKLVAQRDPLEQYLKTEIYDTDEYSWEKPWTTMLRPMAEQLKATDPMTATVGGGLSGFVYGANPIAKMVFAMAGASYFAGASTARVLKTGQMTGGYVPDYVQERRGVEEYFDNLEYVKNRKLELSASMMGDVSSARYFSDMKSRTVASLDYGVGSWEFNAAAMKALPSRERAFFQDFLNAPAANREEILGYVPEYIKPVYQAAWAKQGDTRFTYRHFQRGADARVSEYFSKHVTPAADWAGWHPDVNMDHVRVKTADAVGNSASDDLHRMGIWNNTAEQARNLYPGHELDLSDIYSDRPGMRQDMMQMTRSELTQAGMDDVTIENDLAGGLENLMAWGVQQNNQSLFSLAESVLRS